MISVFYNKNGNKYSVACNGHAGYAEKGQDIVCSASTMLMYTLAQNLLQMPQALEDCHHSFKDGEITVQAVAKDNMTAVTELVFDVIMTGMQLLAEQYPENVRLSVGPGIEKKEP